MIRYISLFISIILISFTSCVNTDVYSSEFTMRSDLSVEEKLEGFGAKKIYVDEPETYFAGELWLEKLIELTKESEEYILISTFLGSSSERTEPFYDLLCEKAESGVDVYLIIDGVSSYDMTASKDFLTPLYFLRESGVHLIEYSPITFTHLLAPYELMVREHRKMFVFDGRKCAIGGMNINYISIGSGEGGNQRDSMYLFSSSALSSALTDEFVNIWNEMSVEPLDRNDFASYPESDTGSIPSYLFNQGPGGKTTIGELYATLINSAQKEIDLIAFLPVYDDNMGEALRRAKERGVYIKVVVSTEARSFAGVTYMLPDLLEIADEVYLTSDDKEPLLHEKLMIVDDMYTVIGSVNFNYRSMGLSNEIALVLVSDEFALKEKAHLDERIADGSERIYLEDAIALKKEHGSAFAYFLNFYGG